MRIGYVPGEFIIVLAFRRVISFSKEVSRVFEINIRIRQATSTDVMGTGAVVGAITVLSFK